MKLADIRKEYSLKSMEIDEVELNPLIQFKKWMAEAIKAEALEPNAMCLSTLGEDGFPNARIVLLKGLDDPKASLTFFWPEIERQVRVIGNVTKISTEQSDAYFLSRPYSSQLGAWASPQSQEISGREILDSLQTEVEKKFLESPITRPPHWGGYRLLPHRVEFWQGRPSRLHDRLCFDRVGTSDWKIRRLAP
jgi:pyridoxamine 5'-phosphate oxidase